MRADKILQRPIDPRIFPLHFKDTDFAISISGRKSIPSGCHPTIFDPSKAKYTTSARSRRLPMIIKRGVLLINQKPLLAKH